MTEATDKQRKYLVALMQNKRNRSVSEALDLVAEEKLGLDHWTDAPLSKRLVSCVIDIYLGKADPGLYVWAVRKDAEEAEQAV